MPTPPLPFCRRWSTRCVLTGPSTSATPRRSIIDGQQARTALDHARETLAEFFNCHDAEVVFNSGGTEGDNTALFGLLHPGDHLITTSIEHSAILQAANKLANFGVQTTFVAPQPSGLIDPDDILRAIRPETRLISVMLANNETGVLQPVARNRQNCRRHRRFLPH